MSVPQHEHVLNINFTLIWFTGLQANVFLLFFSPKNYQRILNPNPLMQFPYFCVLKLLTKSFDFKRRVLLPLNRSRWLTRNIIADSIDILDLVYNSHACLFKHVVRYPCEVGGHKVACSNAS